jgi:tetratricopeptide (TPR) repeat protein
MPGEITLSVPERILLHLMKSRFDSSSPTAPRDATQEGIGDSVGAYRSYVSTSLKTLVAEGLVTSRLAHVQGHPRRVKAYLLTPGGQLRARGLRESLSPSLPDDGAIAEALLSYAKQRPAPRRVNADLRLLGHSSSLPPVRHFFGRKRELRAIKEFLDSPAASVLIVKGLAGMGKTTLLARSLDLSKAQVFWHRFYEWSTLRTLAQRLAAALASGGGTKLRAAVDGRDVLRTEEMAEALRDDLSSIQLVIVLDDYHNADTETQRFVKALRWAIHGSGAKLCVAGRTIAPFYDRAEVGVSRSVRELSLDGLEPEASVAMLGARSIPEREAREIHDLVGGHPLSLEIVQSVEDARGGGDVRRFVKEEILERLPAMELAMLKRLAVHRRPVALAGVIGDGGTEVADSLEQRGLVQRLESPAPRASQTSGGLLQLHDLLRDFVAARLTAEEARDAHLSAAKHYGALGGDLALLEQAFHVGRAGKKEEAAALLIPSGSRIVGQGYHEELLRLLDELSRRDVGDQAWLGLLLLRIEIEEMKGEWDLARKACDECLAIARRRGSEREVAVLTHRLGVLHYRRGDWDRAVELVETAARMLEAAGDEAALSASLNALGVIAWRRRRLDDAIAHYERALAISRRLGTLEGEARGLNNLGIVRMERGDYQKSVELFSEALGICEKLGDKRTLAILYGNLGDALRLLGSMESRRYYERSRALAEELGFLEQLAEIHLSMGSASRGEERKTHLDEALHIFKRLGASEGVSRVEAALKPR